MRQLRTSATDSILSRIFSQPVWKSESQLDSRLGSAAALPKASLPRSYAQQLQPYISDKAKGNVVRRVAIHIAEACGVHTGQEHLVEISLDTSDAHEIRVAAAFAILRVGNESAKHSMRPLVLSTTAGPDPDDDLKGCGLECCWPEYLSAEELFQALTPQKKI